MESGNQKFAENFKLPCLTSPHLADLETVTDAPKVLSYRGPRLMNVKELCGKSRSSGEPDRGIAHSPSRLLVPIIAPVQSPCSQLKSGAFARGASTTTKNSWQPISVPKKVVRLASAPNRAKEMLMDQSIP